MKDKTILILEVPTGLKKLLVKNAKAEDRSLSSYVRTILAAYLIGNAN